MDMQEHSIHKRLEGLIMDQLPFFQHYTGQFQNCNGSLACFALNLKSCLQLWKSIDDRRQ